ncbi:MAG: sulfite exporter TauE/SafE family protein [Acidobacteriota bacterium]
MTIAHVMILALSGFAAGMVGALFGLGGGILIIPILVLLLKVPMHNAIATSLICVIATSSAAASRNVSTGTANVRLGMTLEVCTVVGAMLGGLLAGILHARTLMTLFGAAMLLMVVPMARGVDAEEGTGGELIPAGGEPEPERGFSRKLDGEYFDGASGSFVRYSVRRLPVAFGISSLAGVLSGLLGVGGGILKVPVLVTYCGIPMKAAAATSNFMIGVTAVASAFVFYGRGDVLPFLTGATAAGVFLGSRSGTSLSGRLQSGRLRKAFAMIMVITAAQMLWKAWRG